jgi:hypothetical protein
MSLAVENLRLRELYQGLVPPAMAAIEPREPRSVTTRVFQWSMNPSPETGDDGADSVYPFWGIFKDL